MATKTSTLKLVIAGDNKGAVQSITGTEKALGGLQGKLGGLGAGLAGAFSVGAVVAFGKKSVDAYSQIAGSVAAIKRVTGESAQDSSLLAFAAQQSGISADKAAVSWRTLAKNIDNGKVAAEGIATTDQNGKLLSYGATLGNIADKVKSLPPGFQRTALALRLFGKSGADMVKVLQNGSAGLEAQRKEMEAYGLEFNDAGLKKYQDFVQAQRDMKAALMGVQVEVAERVVPALTAGANAAAWFGRLPAPVKDAALAVTGLTVGIVGLSAAMTAWNAIVAPSLGTLTGLVTGSGAAAQATGLLAAAEEAAAVAAASEAAATQALTAALLAGGGAEAEFAIAAEAKAVASAAAATAAETEAAATAGVGASAGGAAAALGPLALAVLAVVGAYKAYQAIKSGGDSFDIDTTDALKATNAELVKNAQSLVNLGGGQKEFAEAGRQNIDVLYATRDAAKAQGVELPGLAAAIKQVEAENKRATDRQAEYADKTDDTTAAVGKLTTETEKYISVQDRVATTVANSLAYTGELTDAYTAHDESVQAVRDANSDLADSEAAVGEAQAQAAEDRRQATEAVGEAEAKVRDALDSVADAQHGLNQERIDAVQRIKDLERAERDAATASLDAAHKLREAKAEQRRINADPRSSALDKEGAAIAVRQAQDDARNATEDAAQAERDATEAKRRGVEGDADVVKAREAVADANKGVTDAEHDLAKARENVGRVEAESAKKITAARAEVVKAIDKTRDAAFAEAKAWGDLVGKQFGAVAGMQAYRDKLKALSDDLDPNAPLAQRIERIQAEIARAIELARQQAGAQTTAPTRNPDSRAPNQPGDSLNRATGGSLRGGGVTIIQNLQGTPRQANRAAAAASTRVLDKIARGTR